MRVSRTHFSAGFLGFARASFLLMVAASTGWTGAAWGVPSAEALPTSAKEIMERNDRAQRHRSVQASARLKTEGGKRKASTKEFTWSRKLQKDQVHFLTRTEFHSPADIKGEVILLLESPAPTSGDSEKAENEILIYLPAFKKVRRVETDQQSGSFMGSDFSYSDLTGIHVDDFEHKNLKKEPCPSTSAVTCWVIESKPAQDSVRDRLSYERIQSWVRQDNFMAERMDYFDLENQLSKRLMLTEIKKLDSGQFFDVD